jgi:drug/metabolite transporter (DMT)-like permease
VNARAIAVASSMNLTSYLLVLFAFRLSKAGYVVAARETSIVLSVLIGSLLMREGHASPRLAGAARPRWGGVRRVGAMSPILDCSGPEPE